jgi:hypothetical protein
VKTLTIRRPITTLLLVLTACALGCRTKQFSPITDDLLDDPHAQLTVVSIYPWPGKDIAPEYLHNPRVQDFAILKSQPVTNPAERQNIVDALRKSTGGEFGPWACVFEPHHALTLRSAAASSDIVICFRCGEINWRDRRGKNESGVPSHSIDRSLLPLLDGVLRAR